MSPRTRISHRSFQKTRIASFMTAAVFLSGTPSSVLAQELEEVIVTATKRLQSVQDVPLAITALSGDFVQNANLNDVKDLVAFTPGVTGNSQDSFIDAISVRGVRTQDFGIGGDSSSAFFKNDLYEGRNGAVVTSLYDVDRVEVLRGPQGFLFGRSAIGGAFSVHTARAEIGSNDGAFSLDFAERDRRTADAALNIPVNDVFAIRLAGYSSEEGGFVDNLSGLSDDLIEHDKQAIRFSTTTEFDKLSVYTTLEYETREQSGSVYRAVTNDDAFAALEAAIGPIPVPDDPEDISVDLIAGDSDDADIFTAGLRIDYDLGFATLTSNTGYKDHDYFYEEDYDGTPLPLNNYRQDQEGDYFQQELRLTSNNESDKFSWYAGVSYYKENIDAEFTFSSSEDLICQYYGAYYNPGQTFSGCAEYYPGFTGTTNGLLEENGFVEGKYTGFGTYVNLDFALSETLDISLGLRYTRDTKEFDLKVPTPISELGAFFGFGFTTTDFIRDKESFDDLTPRVIATWKPTDEAIVFASFTQGFKSGGFGTFALTDPSGNSAIGNTDIRPGTGFTGSRFNSEFIDSFELGYKDTWFSGSTLVSFTAFYYDYEDLQVVVNDGNGSANIGNAGQVDGLGLESSITTRLSDRFTLFATAAYLDTEATQLQELCNLDDTSGCEGSSLFWAPDFSGALVLTGNYPVSSGNIRATLEATWESERGGGFESLESTKIDPYVEMAFRISYVSDQSWTIGAYIENLTDEFTYDGENNIGGLVPNQFFGPKRPRTIGVTLGYAWE